MWQLLIALLILILLILWISRLSRKKTAPDAVFVCDVCGEKDCVCHKEE